MTRVQPGYEAPGLTGKEKKYVIVVEVERCDQEHKEDETCWKCGGFKAASGLVYDTIEKYNTFNNLDEVKQWIEGKLP